MEGPRTVGGGARGASDTNNGRVLRAPHPLGGSTGPVESSPTRNGRGPRRPERRVTTKCSGAAPHVQCANPHTGMCAGDSCGHSVHRGTRLRAWRAPCTVQRFRPAMPEEVTPMTQTRGASTAPPGRSTNPPAHGGPHADPVHPRPGKRLSWVSSRAPGPTVPEHGVEDGEELPQDGHRGDLWGWPVVRRRW
jgi:hypothetical protein